MKKIYFIAAFFLLLAITGCNKQAAVNTNQTADNASSEQINVNAAAPTDESAAESATTDQKAYVIDAIKAHNTGTDCWLAINGKVYNVTEYVGSHPGGKSILQGCGQNATTLFETRPMGSKTPHSDKARTELEKYYIGELLTN